MTFVKLLRPHAEDAYVMIHHPGHFVIYDQASKSCLFDMSCLPLSKEEKTRGDMELVAVIPELRINLDLLQDPHVNAVGLASAISWWFLYNASNRIKV